MDRAGLLAGAGCALALATPCRCRGLSGRAPASRLVAVGRQTLVPVATGEGLVRPFVEDVVWLAVTPRARNQQPET